MAIKPESLAYIAGFFDGEGCICIFKRNVYKPEKTYTYYDYRIDIANNEKDVLDWIKHTVGFGCVVKKSRSGNRKQGWSYVVSGSRTIEFLNLIKPYLRCKLRRAEIAIEFQLTKGNRKKEYQGGATKESLDARERLYHEIKALNYRGIGEYQPQLQPLTSIFFGG
jgi:hypothetical protein